MNRLHVNINITVILMILMVTACQAAGPAVSVPSTQPAEIATVPVTETPVVNPTLLPTATETAPVQEKILILTSDREIVLVDPDGQNARRYSVGPGLTAAALSLDGRHVAYSVDEPLTHVVYLLDVQTGVSTKISQGQIGGGFDTILWAKTGDWLIFSGTAGESDIMQIYSLDVSTGALAPLTHFTKGTFENIFVSLGSWSADGSALSFSYGVMPDNDYSHNTLETLDVKSGEIRTVLDEAHSGDITHLGGAWLSPDGQAVFFEGKQNEAYHIFRVGLDGSGIIRVSGDDIKSDVSGPVVFSPDGQSFFAYAADQKAGDLAGVPSLFSIDGRLIRQLSDYPGKVVSWNKVVDAFISGHVSEKPTETFGETPAVLDLFNTIQDLIDKEVSHYNTSGWILSRQEYIDLRGTGWVHKLENSIIAPVHYVTETVYHVADRKITDQFVTTFQTMSGEILLNEIYTGGVEYWPQLGTTITYGPWEMTTLDDKFLIGMLQVGDPHRDLAEMINHDGNREVRITAYSNFPGPVAEEGIDQLIIKRIQVTYYDPTSGWPIQTAEKAILQDGSEKMLDRILYTIQTNITPSAAILQKLADKK